ncbi:hypothetical protein BDN72DRAFT_770850, partial [Pluteus cervinus]
QGSVFSAIGRGISAVVGAIANVIMTIVNGVTTVLVTICDLITDCLCCRCCGSGSSRSRSTGRRRFGRRNAAAY